MSIDHFKVVCSGNDSEAGGDRVLINASLFFVM